ncbi:CynX/NimT family MFS transporter [Granulicoccus phenolivorans]|uniref:MFS transporter n=1 Tax=Granulicoccus phenolivorans TaxID=266854 RepID=UPI000409148F|nr:MFS transporter [Granulicoccus phenolivorans]
MTSPATTSTRRIPYWILLVIVVGIGLNLRSVLGAAPVLFDHLVADLGLTATGMSLLSSISLIVMGVCAPLGHQLATRFTPEWAIFAALMFLAVGSILRLWTDGAWVLYVTAALTGAGMGAATALMPGFIAHGLRRIRGTATGIFSLSMAMSVAIAAAITAPLADAAGWRFALAVWGFFALVVAAGWLLLIRPLQALPESATTPPAGEPDALPTLEEGLKKGGLPWTDRTAQLVTLIAMLVYLLGFSCVAWIAPSMLSVGYSATEAAGLFLAFQFVQVTSMIGLPIIADFTTDRRPLLGLCALTPTIGFILLLINMHELALPAMLLMGFGIGGASTLVLIVVTDTTGSQHEAGRLNAMSLLVSYLLGAGGPFLIGLTRDLTGSFVPGYAILLGAAVLFGLLVPFLNPRRRVVG